MKSYETVLAEYDKILESGKIIDEFSLVLPHFEESLLLDLIKESIAVLSEQPSLLTVPSPCTIVGDIHGNIFDLLRILKRFPNYKGKETLLFLGDYVDRGTHSIDVISVLLALVCKYPNRVFLLRGNHEFMHINLIYGFYDEVFICYRSTHLWEAFQNAFAWMPFAAVVGDQIFCVHGGLSPQVQTLQQIMDIKRPLVSYESTPMISDLVWSDPHESVSMFGENSRGSGVLFGTSAIRTFLTNVNLKMMVRAHQCVVNGFCPFADNIGVTVFSSSDYCNIMHNKCGVMYFHGKQKIEIYSMKTSTFLTARPTITMKLGKGLGMVREEIKTTTLKQTKRTTRPPSSGVRSKPATPLNKTVKKTRTARIKSRVVPFAY